MWFRPSWQFGREREANTAVEFPKISLLCFFFVIGFFFIFALYLNRLFELKKLKCVIFPGAIAAFTISKVNCNWYSMGDFFFAVGSLVACGVLLCCVYCKNLYLIYIFYIIYGMMYQTMLTIAE